MKINDRIIQIVCPPNVKFMNYIPSDPEGIADNNVYAKYNGWSNLIAGEGLKTLDGVQIILHYLATHYHRPVIVIGGGTVQDAAGFALAIYKRGTPWIFYPTTLLSMADSCIGDKVGLNYDGAKNQLGLFTGPKEVRICIEHLKTLPKPYYDSGMGEILKLFLLNDSKPPSETIADMKYVIQMALTIKNSIIAVDPYDLKERKVLNLGHTLGHAFEAMSDYTLPHGICVAYGIYLMNIWSSNQGNFTRHFEDWQNTLKSVFQPYPFDFPMTDLLDYVAKDKKAHGSQITLAIMIEPGHSFLTEMHIKQFCDEIQQIIEVDRKCI